MAEAFTVRLILAFQAFFALLFSGSLPKGLLPPPVEPKEPEDKKAEREKLKQDLAELEGKHKKGLEDLENKLKASEKELAEVKQALSDAKAGAGKTEELEGKVKAAEESAAAAEAKLKEARDAQGAAEDKLKEARDAGALALLAWLQREGRLIDFLMEDVDDYEDEQIGAAVRAIHKGCRKVLQEGLKLEAIMPGEDEATVEVPVGFDPVSIQLTGNVKGEPPFKGTLMHHGWRTETVAVPVPETVDPRILAAAEVEL